MTGKIKHVTDTAFWVASFRALESARPEKPACELERVGMDLSNRTERQALLARRMAKKLKAAPWEFRDPDLFGFFRKRGFLEHETISSRQEALRLGRRPPFFSPVMLLTLPISGKWKAFADRTLGYTLLKRSDAP